VSGVFQYYDKAVRGTEREDMLVLLQFFQGMVGQHINQRQVEIIKELKEINV
jgi:hypothetical protein